MTHQIQITSPPNATPDEEIKSLSATHPALACELVVRKYREPLFRHARYILKDNQLAADVCQEVFIKSLKETRFFDEEFKMKAWLFRVTSNLCLNMVRDRKRRGAILETIPKKTVTHPNQFESVFCDERQQSILEAMEHLSPNHRQILMQRFYSDLSYAEIADELNIKLGTVMSRLSRAKRALLEVLTPAPPALV
jgi:RNA polymerase sigma-70 factor (ECF subfamily)